jgi:hypothetical protein
MKHLINTVMICAAVVITVRLIDMALHFLWFPAMMLVVALVLIYLVLNQRR